MSQKDFSAICHQYALDVDSEKISACLYVKQAVKRYLNDLEKTDWQWHFDKNKVDHVCRFIELLPHTRGKWATARQRIVLEPFQVFIVANIFGWVDVNGRRRYRYAYVEMPRKNGKSTLLAAVGLYCAFIEGEQGAQVYSAAIVS